MALKYHTGSVHGKVKVNGGSSSSHNAGASGVVYHEAGEGVQVYKKVRYRWCMARGREMASRCTGR